MSKTRGGEAVSAQIGKIGAVTGLANGNFKLEGVALRLGGTPKLYEKSNKQVLTLPLFGGIKKKTNYGFNYWRRQF